MFFLPALALGCVGSSIRWRPSLVSQVPDSTAVRLERVNARDVSGRSFGWDRGRPRVVTSLGDTILVERGMTLRVLVPDRATHTTAGIVIGWVLGVGISYATCGAPKRYCGEQDPTPLIGIGLGALIGSRVKTERWVRVAWDSL
jgi:hypothetical protein